MKRWQRKREREQKGNSGSSNDRKLLPTLNWRDRGKRQVHPEEAGSWVHSVRTGVMEDSPELNERDALTSPLPAFLSSAAVIH
jgi:hypothetical protein